MNIADIKELVQVVVESGVAELEVTRGDSKVRICRAVTVSAPESVTASRPAPAHQSVVAHAAPAPQPAMAASASTADAVSDPSLIIVKSPIVGTYYESAAPNTPAFVKVGDTVHPGQVLCIIESMKLMNEIEAEVAGVIVGKLVENGRPVEYGEAMFSLRPL